MDILDGISFNISSDELNLRLCKFFGIPIIDFTESENFITFLTLFHSEFSIYDNWFNGQNSFEENFLLSFLFYLSRHKNFKKVENLKQKIKRWQNVN